MAAVDEKEVERQVQNFRKTLTKAVENADADTWAGETVEHEYDDPRNGFHEVHTFQLDKLIDWEEEKN